MLRLGEKIRTLRKQQKISQSVLANHLGVSFQSVSKWERGVCTPDLAQIPAIAAFFGVSTDELLDYSSFQTECSVCEILAEGDYYRLSNPAICESILKDGLKKHPGNAMLLNRLIEVIPVPERSGEVIALCKMLIETTQDHGIRANAWNILEKAYKAAEYPPVKYAPDPLAGK